jgi:hypothetical protein
LAAYDIKTGQLAWKGYSMGPDGDTIINPSKTTTWENGKTVTEKLKQLIVSMTY